jgi:HPr kinase/phosphorylase
MTTLHGALLDVHGVGVLLLGGSGVGKSECALDLVARGHRLVADDVVELETGPDGGAIGRAPRRVRHYMEIRGLGIIFIPDLFGPERVRDEMRVELICRLERWSEGAEYDRLGLDWTTEDVAGTKVAALTLAARPGASMATIVDVAAREYRQRRSGVNAAQRLDAQLRSEMRQS